MNAINIIHPYWKYGTWCFTDENKGLRDEPFVAGADVFISGILEEKEILKEAINGFNLTFSDIPFPDYDIVVYHVKDESLHSGNWYTGVVYAQECKFWLCPALFKYFDVAPNQIYAKFNL